jgi:hypothetical protein
MQALMGITVTVGTLLGLLWTFDLAGSSAHIERLVQMFF